MSSEPSKNQLQVLGLAHPTAVALLLSASLFLSQKFPVPPKRFPVPFRREFYCNRLNLLAD
jgi:hypothetical protein